MYTVCFLQASICSEAVTRIDTDLDIDCCIEPLKNFNKQQASADSVIETVLCISGGELGDNVLSIGDLDLATIERKSALAIRSSWVASQRWGLIFITIIR